MTSATVGAPCPVMLHPPSELGLSWQRRANAGLRPPPVPKCQPATFRSRQLSEALIERLLPFLSPTSIAFDLWMRSDGRGSRRYAVRPLVVQRVAACCGSPRRNHETRFATDRVGGCARADLDRVQSKIAYLPTCSPRMRTDGDAPWGFSFRPAALTKRTRQARRLRPSQPSRRNPGSLTISRSYRVF